MNVPSSRIFGSSYFLFTPRRHSVAWEVRHTNLLRQSFRVYMYSIFSRKVRVDSQEETRR